MPGAYEAVDARIAALLAEVPAFRQWRGEALEPQIRRWIETADRQVVMTLVAEGLRRLGEDGGTYSTS